MKNKSFFSIFFFYENRQLFLKFNQKNFPTVFLPYMQGAVHKRRRQLGGGGGGQNLVKIADG